MFLYPSCCHVLRMKKITSFPTFFYTTRNFDDIVLLGNHDESNSIKVLGVQEATKKNSIVKPQVIELLPRSFSSLLTIRQVDDSESV